MGLRAAGRLQLYLNRQLTWRKKELTSLKFCVAKAQPADQPILLRAAIGLLYAHWEGFIKDSASAYLEHAAAQGLTFAKLRPHLRAIALRRQFLESARSTGLSTRRSFFELLESGLDVQAKFSTRGVIRTRANLKADIFKDIMVGLGLDYAPFILKEKPIIDRLVSLRNAIMHGRGAPVDVVDYFTLHGEIVLLIDEFKSQLEGAAGKRTYAA